jgi:23S rRNA (uracil1939-C5)-methyltransferase
MLRHSTALDRWMVNIITSASNPDVLAPLADQLRREFPQIVSIVNNVTARKAGIAVGEFEIHLAGERSLKERIGPFWFEISANSFFQTNSKGAARLYDTVRNYCRLTGTQRVLDLYSGAGTIPVYLAGLAAEVVGMEMVETAVEDARRNCWINGVNNCRFVAGDIRNNLSGIDFRPDVMVIDPPRDGMHKDVVQQVLDMGPPRIVYVSCNPSTLARDLALMKAHYRAVEIQPVDMFPHTYHIESVTLMERITDSGY